ncbi:hypothetical protein ACIRSS_26390 [Amycolatopsis sp. NPDC101161]|uniref:hypothetical protein n=1 Tax=Amycolatopsis sp. NPDC101161 TaxID=3363940 RepID=UPI0038058832
MTTTPARFTVSVVGAVSTAACGVCRAGGGRRQRHVRCPAGARPASVDERGSDPRAATARPRWAQTGDLVPARPADVVLLRADGVGGAHLAAPDRLWQHPFTVG